MALKNANEDDAEGMGRFACVFIEKILCEIFIAPNILANQLYFL